MRDRFSFGLRPLTDCLFSQINDSILTQESTVPAANSSIDKTYAFIGDGYMIEVYLFEQLDALARYGTLSAASGQRHITQPSMNRAGAKRTTFGGEIADAIFHF